MRRVGALLLVFLAAGCAKRVPSPSAIAEGPDLTVAFHQVGRHELLYALADLVRRDVVIVHPPDGLLDVEVVNARFRDAWRLALGDWEQRERAGVLLIGPALSDEAEPAPKQFRRELLNARLFAARPSSVLWLPLGRLEDERPAVEPAPDFLLTLRLDGVEFARALDVVLAGTGLELRPRDDRVVAERPGQPDSPPPDGLEERKNLRGWGDPLFAGTALVGDRRLAWARTPGGHGQWLHPGDRFPPDLFPDPQPGLPVVDVGHGRLLLEDPDGARVDVELGARLPAATRPE